jgi:hypothetical protein
VLAASHERLARRRRLGLDPVRRQAARHPFGSSERVFAGAAELDAYLREPIDARGGPARGWRARRRLARRVSGG